jgi:phospholipase C
MRFLQGVLLLALISGSVFAQVATLTPGSLAFGNQTVGTVSATQLVTLTNTGTTNLTITRIAATNPFAQKNNCKTGLSVGASCTIQITFAPIAAGPFSGSVKITDNASPSPQVINLTGTGMPPGITAIQHVVFIIKENRSFDEYFGQFPGANGVGVGEISTGQATICPTPR